MDAPTPVQGLTAALVVAALWAAPVRADVSSSYALQITETQVDFTIAVNGIPKAQRHGARLAAVPYFLEDLLHQGHNQVTITLRATDPAATLVLVLSAPGADPNQDGPELARLQCGLPEPTGAHPACKPTQTVNWTINLAHAPNLRLWNAEPAPPPTASTIAESLLQIDQSLVQNARAQNWRQLFLIDELRGQDLVAARGSMPGVAQQMAAFFAKAEASRPGRLASTPAPDAAALQITPLAGHLLLVSRRDGKPLLSIQIGDGTVPGAGRQLAFDPEDSGDEADRFITGQFVVQQAIYGSFGKKWQLIR